MILNYLGTKYDTDKSSRSHGYCDIYELYFAPIRFHVNALLEIGLGSGASLAMWTDYFPNAKIYGLDINHFNPTVRIARPVEIYNFCQSDETNLRHTFENKNLEIVIDDASHDPENTFKSFSTLFPCLTSGGYYCIEDLGWGFEGRIYQWLDSHKDMFGFLNVHSDLSQGATLIVARKK